MTITAQQRLDDPPALEAADPGGMLRQVASAAAQIRTALRAVTETDLGPVVSPRPAAGGGGLRDGRIGDRG